MQDGIVLGADTRATEGTVVADKNCSKIHYIAKNIQYVLNKNKWLSVLYNAHPSCCGAGTAADTEFTTNFIASKIELHKLNTGRVVSV